MTEFIAGFLKSQVKFSSNDLEKIDTDNNVEYLVEWGLGIDWAFGG